MSLQEQFDKLDNRCVPLSNNGFNWTAEGIGFGQLYFYTKNGVVYCDNELMGKEFIKKMLCQMVDECVLTCPSSKDKE